MVVVHKKMIGGYITNLRKQSKLGYLLGSWFTKHTGYGVCVYLMLEVII